MLLVLIFLIGLSLGTFQVSTQTQGTCQGTLTYFSASPTTTCSASPCTCSSNICTTTTCQSTTPSIPNGLIGYTQYNNAGCPSGIIFGMVYGIPGCSVSSGTSSSSFTCNGNILNTNDYSSNTICSGTPSQSNSLSNICSTSNIFVSNCYATTIPITNVVTTRPAIGFRLGINIMFILIAIIVL